MESFRCENPSCFALFYVKCKEAVRILKSKLANPGAKIYCPKCSEKHLSILVPSKVIN